MERFAAYDWQCVVAVLVPALLFVSCFFESHDPLRYYTKYFLYGAYSSVIAISMIPYILLSPKDVRNSERGAFFLRYYTKLLGIEWDIRGTDELGKQRGCIVVANHQSVLDILGMFQMWHIMGKCAAVARTEVSYILPFGPIAWLAGVVFISRNNGKKSMKKLSETGDLVKNCAGTRNKNILGNGLQSFKKGAFRIAIENQVPVLPVVYSPYYFIEGKTYFFGHGKMIIKTLEAIPTEGLEMKDIDDLIEKTRSLMQKEFVALASEILATLPNDYQPNMEQRQQFAKSLQS